MYTTVLIRSLYLNDKYFNFEKDKESIGLTAVINYVYLFN